MIVLHRLWGSRIDFYAFLKSGFPICTELRVNVAQKANELSLVYYRAIDKNFLTSHLFPDCQSLFHLLACLAGTRAFWIAIQHRACCRDSCFHDLHTTWYSSKDWAATYFLWMVCPALSLRPAGGMIGLAHQSMLMSMTVATVQAQNESLATPFWQECSLRQVCQVVFSKRVLTHLVSYCWVWTLYKLLQGTGRDRWDDETHVFPFLP